MAAAVTDAATSLRDGLRWAAHGTSTDVVADNLRRLLLEADQLHGDHLSLRTLNLLVSPYANVPATVHAGGRRAVHPARMVRLCQHADDRLDAEVAVRLVEVGDARMHLLMEDVTLHGNAARLVHAESLIAPLLARGIPTVAWLPGYDHDEIDEALARVAHVTVFDSDLDPEPGRALMFAHETALEHPSRDLAWLRSAHWRSRIAATFEDEAAQGALAFMPSGEIVGDPALPSTVLLAAWVAARAEINVTLRPGDGAPIESITIAGIRVDPGHVPETVGAPLMDALDTVYSAPRGYEDALRAMDRVAIVP